MIKTRPSSMPRVFECPSSMLPAQAPINNQSDESDLGDAAHEALAMHVNGIEPDLAMVASRHGVTEEDLAPLYRNGVKAWKELRRFFPSPLVEARLDETDITPGGQTDALQVGDTLVVLDWKSGRSRRNYRAQVEAYAYEARAKYGMPASGVIHGIVVWLRHGEYEVIEITDVDLAVFSGDYRALVAEAGKRFAPGDACGFCPRQYECEARKLWVQASAEALAPVASVQLTPALLGELYPRAKALEKALDAYNAALREEAARGPIPLPDGSSITLEEQRRESIDAQAAWPELVSFGLSQDDLAECTSISKGSLEKVVKAKAPRGMKDKHAAQLMQRLRASGAISTTTHLRLERVAKGEK